MPGVWGSAGCQPRVDRGDSRAGAAGLRLLPRANARPPALLAELQHYAAQQASHQQRAAAQQRAGAVQQAENVEASVLSPLAMFWAFGPMLALNGLYYAAVLLDLVAPGGLIAGGVQAVSGLLLPAGWGGYLWYQRSASRRRGAPNFHAAISDWGTAVCPSCGALTPYCSASADAAEQVQGVCGYCRTPLVAPSGVLNQALAAAAQTARAARLHRYGVKRRGQHSWIDRVRVPLAYVTGALGILLAVVAGFVGPWLAIEAVPELAPSERC